MTITLRPFWATTCHARAPARPGEGEGEGGGSKVCTARIFLAPRAPTSARTRDIHGIELMAVRMSVFARPVQSQSPPRADAGRGCP